MSALLVVGDGGGGEGASEHASGLSGGEEAGVVLSDGGEGERWPPRLTVNTPDGPGVGSASTLSLDGPGLGFCGEVDSKKRVISD